jgi:nucleotide-binding universal stress UspA family protein
LLDDLAMKVLLALDGSTASKNATRAVAERPWPEGTMVRVLSVAHWIPPTTPFFNEVAVDYERLVREFLDAASEIAKRAADELEGAGLRVESAVRQGDPRVAIIDEATDWGANLIVMGSHGRTGIERWLMGSVAEYVVRHAQCSVEVVRAANQPEKPAVSGGSQSPEFHRR